MKKSTLALVVMGVVASASVHAAEVYNKNGNKLDVYGKVKAMHYLSDDDTKDGDQTYVRFGFKGETQINDQLTGYGRWEAEFSGNKAESDSTQKTRLAQLIKDVYGIDDALRAIAGDSVSGLGTGGMGTKLQAADVACRAGIDTIIAAGSRPGVIGDVMEGISVGTRFHAQASPLENRKRWIFGAPPAGEITVDEGATAAILERGSSLLPKGIKSVTGNFSRGEVIRICNLEGRDIAHGVSRYNSDALRRIAGHHSQQIDAILGYEYGPVAVHRDDMIIR